MRFVGKVFLTRRTGSAYFPLRLGQTSPFMREIHVEMEVYLNKGKSVSLQAWSGPEGSRKLSFPDFMTTAQDGGKVVSLTHWPLLPPGNTPGTHFC